MPAAGGRNLAKLPGVAPADTGGHPRSLVLVVTPA
jgi:hypothetical protein